MEAKILILAFLWLVRIIRLKYIWGWYNRRLEDNDKHREPFALCPIRQNVVTAECCAFYLAILVLIKFLLSPAPGLIQIYLGLTVYILGFTVTCLGRVHLGASWADMFFVNDNNCLLVKHGIYSVIRNPIYVGRYVMQLGFGITLGVLSLDWSKDYFDSIVSVIEVLVVSFSGPIYLWLLVVHHQEIKGEEEYLLSKYGDDYTAYMAKVGRYLPRPKRLLAKIIHTKEPVKIKYASLL